MTIRLRVRRGLRRARSPCEPGARRLAAGWRPATTSAVAVSPRARCPQLSDRHCEPASSARRGVRTRLPTDDAAAAAASGATRFADTAARGGGSAAAGVSGKADSGKADSGGADSGTIIAGSSTSTPSPAGGVSAGGLPSAAGASSSLRMRRIEARMSSIEGSAPVVPGGVCEALIVTVFSATRLVGRVVAKTGPLVLHRIVVGGVII